MRKNLYNYRNLPAALEAENNLTDADWEEMTHLRP
jgi:hypothetical protein